MSDDEKTERQYTDLPEKIADRIKEHQERDEGEIVVGNGEIELTSKHPVRVVEYFLSVDFEENSDSTYDDYSYDLTRFLEYCEYLGRDDLSELSSSDLEGFKDWRKKDGNIVLVTLEGQLINIRVFLRWCQRLGIVEKDLANEMELPDVDPSDEVSYIRLDEDEARKIIDYHSQFDFVTREFAEFALMWGVLFRLGDCRSIDLDNYNREEGYIALEHALEEDTPLKNGEGEIAGEGGERRVNLPDWVCDILNTYIDGTGDPEHPQRIETTDEYGRQPLFTTRHGRVSKITIRRDLYRITQPCRYDHECPHGRNPDDCEARNDYDSLSQCPSGVSPHPVRRGGICHQLSEGVPKETICDRADVSLDVLNKHYDIRTNEEARQQRRDKLRKHLEGYDDSTQNRIFPRQDQAPLLDSLVGLANAGYEALNHGPTRTKFSKGVAAYCLFVLLIGINFALLGIGFNPLTGALTLPL